MQYEIIDDIIKNATQPLYDKLTEIEKLYQHFHGLPRNILKAIRTITKFYPDF